MDPPYRFLCSNVALSVIRISSLAGCIPEVPVSPAWVVLKPMAGGTGNFDCAGGRRDTDKIEWELQ